MLRHEEPKLYQRGDTWWCYWRGDRWSTKTTDLVKAKRAVREKYDPRVSSALRATIEDAARLLNDALELRGRTEATREQAKQKLGHFVTLWADVPLQDVTHATLTEYIRTRLNVDGVTRVTVSHELGYLRQAWKLARAQGWSLRSWDEIMPERFDRKYTPRTRWLTKPELDGILAALDPPRAAWVAWVVATGCDVSDVPRASRDDVDWARELVHVHGTKTRFRDRWVPITSLTRPLLKLALKHGPPFTGAWVTKTSPNIVLRKLAKRLKMDHFTPKDLRRTHGQWLRHGGTAPHLIGRVLGHADSVMADRVYGQGDDEKIAELVRRSLRTQDVRISKNTRTNRTNRKKKSG